MMNELLAQHPTAVACLVLTAGLSTVGAFLHVVSNLAWSRRRVGLLGGLGVPFIGTVSALFALFTGFVASEAWDRQARMGRAVLAERDALVATHQLSIATVSDMSAIRDRIRAYVRTALDEEWPAMAIGGSSEATGQALTALLATAVDPVHTVGSGSVAHAEIVRQVTAIRAARSDRLNLSASAADMSKWLAVIALAIMTQVGLALIHSDKPSTQVVALVVFTLAASSALCAVAAADRPFGAEPVDARPFERALNAFEAERATLSARPPLEATR